MGTDLNLFDLFMFFFSWKTWGKKLLLVRYFWMIRKKRYRGLKPASYPRYFPPRRGLLKTFSAFSSNKRYIEPRFKELLLWARV